MSRDIDEVELEKTRHIDGPLGARLRLERTPRMTREKMAESLDVALSTVQKWENGGQRIPAARLWQICRLLDLDVSELFRNLPHQVVGNRAGWAEVGTRFDQDDGRAKRVIAVAKAASKLPGDRLEIAEDILRALAKGDRR